MDYCARLSEEQLPDPRVAEVGVVASTAIFGRTEPPPDVQAWADDVLRTVAAAHEPPSRLQRRKKPAAAAAG